MNGVPLLEINELEYCPDDGFLYANVWHSTLIVKIDLHLGIVVDYYDMASTF